MWSFAMQNSYEAAKRLRSHSVFTRKKRCRFDFSEDDRGKTVYFCAHYENAKGDVGPWGPIVSALIP
jgi:hypothetical protein